MVPRVTPWLLLLFRLSYAQATTTISGQTGSDGSAVTVTSISTLAIVILPPSNTSIGTEIESSTTTTSATSTSSTLALPTAAYTGQAILVGTCNVPQYTTLALHGGVGLEVPLVGCSDDRPECCPSLSPPDAESTESSLGVSSAPASSSAGLAATGIISRLSASPLSICPHDFVDIDPVCCPR
jgi:hypothetical protein